MSAADRSTIPPRWFTCTPVDFGGGEDFFVRDSGLICRGLQAIGCTARAIMPGPSRPDDCPELIRTELLNLESPEWWKQHDLDGVVLYSWGSPRFRKVAKAIHDAGIFLVLNQDNGGLVSPLVGFRLWLREQHTISGGRISGFLKQTIRGLLGIIFVDPGRAAHLKAGDVIGCVSPAAAGHYRRLCCIYGGASLASRIEVLPHPVEPRFLASEDSRNRPHRIVCLGRWDDVIQKRPALMLEVFSRILKDRPNISIGIAGTITNELEAWRSSLPSSFFERVTLYNSISREQLTDLLRVSRIFYSPSSFESFGIAAAEALCSGCSLVAEASPSLASFGWFTSHDSGRLAENDAVATHFAALQQELDAWDQGDRDPISISRHWAGIFHASQVAEKMLELHARAQSR